VSLFKARVFVHLRPSVLDPAGEAARSATKRLGIDGVTQLRIGKSIELQIEAENKEDARSKIELMSDRLLANPVIEDWTMELNEDQQSINN
tara:strand:+ start:225 stop:497 length:273 start_codon:yes stop_codon:yes gene_type:complete